MIIGKLLKSSNPISTEIRFEDVMECLQFLHEKAEAVAASMRQTEFFQFDVEGETVIAQFGSDGSMLQIFLESTEQVEAGWRTLVGEAIEPDADIDDLLRVDFDNMELDGFFRVLGAEGLWLSTKFLNSAEELAQGISELKMYLKSKQPLSSRWYNLGFI